MALHGALAAQLPGEKIAHGTLTPTAASTDIATGLESIRACGVSFRGATVLTHTMNYCTASGGVLTVVTQAPTSADDTTPAAASTPWAALNWWAIGQGAR